MRKLSHITLPLTFFFPNNNVLSKYVRLFRYIIKKINAPTLFATHFHELTELSERYKYVVNYHAEVMQEEDNIVLLYKILPGPCNRSFGIHATVLAGFPESIVKVSN